VEKYKISFINRSLPGYGAYETVMHYHKEAMNRGFDSNINLIDDTVDFYIINMLYGDDEKKLKEILHPNKFVYIEHSIECVLPEKTWIRDFVMPNSFRNYFFSLRHRNHILDAFSVENKILASDNYDYLVVPVDYNIFKPNPEITRDENLNIFVGMIHTNKGVDTILTMAIKNPHKEFLFIGTLEGGDKSEEDFVGASNVKYIGHISKNKLVEYYNKASTLYLLPTNGAVESAGRVVFEAVLCGCNVVVNSDVGNASYPWYNDATKIIENIDISIEKLFNTIMEGCRRASKQDG